MKMHGASTSVRDLRRDLIVGVCVAVAYVAAARLGFLAAFVAEQITTVWAPTGIALAALLLWGRRLWPAVWLAAFAANAGTQAPLWTAAIIATGNTLEAVAAAWLLGRARGFDPGLRRLADTARFIVVAAVLTTIISATIGVTTLCLAGVQPWTRFFGLWPAWWLGDALGALVVAPVILTTFRTAPHRSRQDWRGVGLLILATMVATQVVFGQVLGPIFGRGPLHYVIFPLVVVAAVRFGQPAAAVLVFGASTVTIWHTVRGAGPFASPDIYQGLLLLQVFMGVLASTGLLLAAAMSERQTSQRRRAAAQAVGEVLADAPDVASAAPAILRKVCDTLEWQVGALWLIDGDARRLRCCGLWSNGAVPVTDFVRTTHETDFQLGIGLPGRVWATDRAAWIEDVPRDGNFPRAAVARAAGIRGAFGFPIRLGGDVLGVIEFFTDRVATPDPELLDTMTTVGNEVGQFVGRKRVERAVLDEQRRMRAVLETALDAVIGMDHRGVITEFNPAAERLFGYQKELAVGRVLADLLIPHDLRQQHQAGLARYLSTSEGPYLNRRIETRGCHADGHEFPIELAITRIADEGPARFTGFVRDLTARVQADRERERLIQRELDARREGERRVADVLEALTDGFQTIDRDWRWTYVNPALKRMWAELGLDGDVLGRGVFEVFPEARETELGQSLRRAVTERIPIETESFYPPFQRWYFVRYFPMPDGGVSMFSQDITARKQAEEAVRVNEERFRSLAASSSALTLYEQDQDLRYRWVFPQHPEFPNQNIGKTDVELLPSGEGERLSGLKQAVLQSGVGRREEITVTLPTETRSYDLMIEPRRDSGGAIVGVSGVAVDISERKRSEQLLVEHKNVLELIATGRPADECLANVADAVSRLSAHARACVLVADAARTTFVVRHGAPIPLSFAAGLMNPPMNLGMAQRVLRAGATASPDIEHDDRWPATWRELCLSHGIRASHFEPAVSADGIVVGSFMLCLDNARMPSAWELRVAEFGAHIATIVIEREHAEETLRASEERLRDADRRKDEFLAMLAHELRNPLAPIRTGLELVRLAGDTPGAVERIRPMMERQIGHMVRLIDDLLDVSRITSGKIHLQRQAASLAEIVNGAVEANRGGIEAAGLLLSIQLPERQPLLFVDPTRFVQVISNLLHNAAKFTDAGGRIMVRGELVSDGSGGDELVLSVSDTGVGISGEMLPRVFDLFSQGERSTHRPQAGLGIGLALARRLTEMHGGRIDARSAGPGCGSEFTISMPVLDAVAALSDGPPSAAARPEVKRRVLIVDDNADAADTLASLVRTLGGEARTAADGPSGIECASEFTPDVILLDIGMPGMDGYEACRRIRQERFGRRAFIVAITGWGQDGDKRRAAEAGFDAHLTKPADPVVLERLLAEAPATDESAPPLAAS
jgi:PAS domain S-box-containing protein